MPSANGREIREFLFADIEGVYQATDLSLLASHLIHKPIDLAYDKENRVAYIVMNNGNMCALTSFRAEDVQSFSEQITQGKFFSVCVVDDQTYFVVERNGAYFLEKFDSALNTDCSMKMTSEIETDVWRYLDVLNGKAVKVVADDITLIDSVVEEGNVQSEYAANTVEIGLGYAHLIAPLPPSVGASNGVAPVAQVRLVKAVFRIVNSYSLQIDTGNGVHQELQVPFVLKGEKADPITGDVIVRGLGWRRRPTQALWQITGDLPKFFKIVSVTQDLKIGG